VAGVTILRKLLGLGGTSASYHGTSRMEASRLSSPMAAGCWSAFPTQIHAALISIEMFTNESLDIGK
jgi:hypothetical protein